MTELLEIIFTSTQQLHRSFSKSGIVANAVESFSEGPRFVFGCQRARRETGTEINERRVSHQEKNRFFISMCGKEIILRHRKRCWKRRFLEDD